MREAGEMEAAISAGWLEASVWFLESLSGVKGLTAKNLEECLNRKAGASALGSTKI